jgi:hypothetical protein
MGGTGNRAAVEGARAEISATAAEFATAARAVVEAALRRRLEALFRARADWFDSLRPDVVTALRGATERAVAEGAAAMHRRLCDPDLWLSPRVVPVSAHSPHRGWSVLVPGWLSVLLRRLAGADEGAFVGSLDDTGNRVWLAVLAAAKPLDPVLAEFGLSPAEIPDMGGGHYGLRPRTAAELDPSGTLDGLWRRYRVAYERYAGLVAT